MLNAFQQMGLFALLTLLVAVSPAVPAVSYALRPSEAKLSLMRPLSLAGLFGGLSGFLAGAINMLVFAANSPTAMDDTSILLIGSAETLVPLVVSFGSLTVSWLLVALGLRRQGAVSP